MWYYSLNEFLQKTFGGKVYKIALSTGFTCPNRDGTKGTGGCIFCSAAGSGEFAAGASTVTEQIEEAKRRVARKLKSEEKPRYIAYFQSFSNTYGEIEKQRQYFYEAILHPEVAVLSIATRPDCLPEEVLSLLAELAQIKPVWVELGLQTANEETARRINRCYPNACFAKAAEKLHRIGVSVIAHMIVGLPGETHEDEKNTLAYLAALPIAGIKIHLLHVLRGTALSAMSYTPLALEEYTDRVIDLLRYLPKEIVVHRLTGDGDKRTLLAPLWSADKKRVLGALQAKMAACNLVQGEALEKSSGNFQKHLDIFHSSAYNRQVFG